MHTVLGDLMAGRRGSLFYDDEGRVLYDRLSESPAFRGGIARAVGDSRSGPAGHPLGEEDPTDCHRRLLVGRVLGGGVRSYISARRPRADGAEVAADATFRRPRSDEPFSIPGAGPMERSTHPVSTQRRREFFPADSCG